MNKYILSAALLSCLFAACEDVNDKIDGLDDVLDSSKQVVDNSVEYTLTSSDYSYFSTKSYYTSKDPADTTALKLIKTNGAFPSDEFAQKYLPDFIAKNWYQLDNGSSINVTYNLTADGGTNSTVTAVASAKVYELTDADYTAAGATAGYLTPSTLSKLSSVLASAVEATDGDLCIVKYNYSSTEPSSSDGGETTKTTNWTKLDLSNLPAGSSYNFEKAKATIPADYAGQKVRIGFRYTSTTDLAGTIEVASLRIDDGSYILPTLFVKGSKSNAASSSAVSAGQVLLLVQNGDKYYALDKIKDNGKTYGYSGYDEVTVTNGTVSDDDFTANALTLEAAEGGFYVKNTEGRYLYNTGYASFSFADAVADDPTGYVWTFTNVGTTVLMKNVAKGSTAAYSTQYSSIGAYADSKLSSYELTSFITSTQPEGYSFVDVNIGDLSYVWSLTSSYGFKASAYANKTNNEAESWLVGPEVDLTNATGATVLTLDLAANFFNGSAVTECFNAFVTTDYTEGSEFVVAGNKSLKAASTSESKLAIYSYSGSKWSELDDVVVVNPSDYAQMGTTYTNFSSSLKPADYLPTFLSVNFPYAKEGDTKVVAYAYYASGSTTYEAAEYSYTDGAWVAVDNDKATSSSRFLKGSGSWFFDPSITLTLQYDKSDAFAKTFYQAATDWVWENVDVAELGLSTKGTGYVTSYGNNEYYTGSSAYYNNVDWRADKAISQYSDGYTGLTNDEVLAKMKENLITVYGKVLSQLYPAATTIQDVDVYYTINFVAYYAENGGSNAGHQWTVKYKVVGTGEFEYVEDSLQQVEE